MFLRFRSHITCSGHSSHTFRFTHTATGTFPEHRFYCAECEVDGRKYCFAEEEIASFEVVYGSFPVNEADAGWLHEVAGELRNRIEEIHDLEAA
jgi:hypothetical protein